MTTTTTTTTDSLRQAVLLRGIKSDVETFIAQYKVDMHATNLLVHELKQKGNTSPNEFRVETTCELLHAEYKPSLLVSRCVIVSTEGTEAAVQVDAIQINLESRKPTERTWSGKRTFRFNHETSEKIEFTSRSYTDELDDYRIAVSECVWNPAYGRTDDLVRVKTFAAKSASSMDILNAGDAAAEWLEKWVIAEGGCIGRSHTRGLRHVHVNEYDDAKHASEWNHEQATVPQFKIGTGEEVIRYSTKREAEKVIDDIKRTTNESWSRLRTCVFDTMYVYDMKVCIVVINDEGPQGFLARK